MLIPPISGALIWGRERMVGFLFIVLLHLLPVVDVYWHCLPIIQIIFTHKQVTK